MLLDGSRIRFSSATCGDPARTLDCPIDDRAIQLRAQDAFAGLISGGHGCADSLSRVMTELKELQKSAIPVV
jgi:hypothetical protein